MRDGSSRLSRRIREKDLEQKAKLLMPGAIAGRVPPHDMDAEGAVLSACLLSRAAVDVALAILGPEHFYSDANGRIFEAIRELVGAGIAVDIVNVASFLRDRERLQQIGGPTYLAQLSDATPAVAHVADHAKVVYEKWRVRALIATCQRIAAEGYGDVGDVQEFIEEAEHEITTLGQSGRTNDTMSHVGPVVDAAYASTSKMADTGKHFSGLATGIERFDIKIGGLQAGDLTIVAARPGMGKTSLVLGWSVTVASKKRVELRFPDGQKQDVDEDGSGVLIFSLEMPKAQLGARMISTEGRVDLGKVRSGYLDTDDWGRLVDATSYIRSLPIWIDDKSGGSLQYIRSKVRKLRAELEAKGRKLGLVIVDYLQLMSANPGSKAQNREQEIAEMSRGLKQLAKEENVAIIALSQLSRACELRADKRPMLSDLRESGAIEADADNIVFVFRQEYYSPDDTELRGLAELILAKQRNGPPGKVLTRFTGSCTRFDNLANGDYPEHDDQ